MNPDLEGFIREAFDLNYERIRLETGRAVTPNIREAALEQVLLYARRMREVAENVTDTEVKLTLPEQRTPLGRRFTLEGVVDIVREGDQTTMYDVKTHLDADSAYGQLGQYVQQLNLYAHIWHGLRGQPLDETAIIATRPTRELRQALRDGTPATVTAALEKWQPCISIPLDEQAVDATVEAFGTVVDQIEGRAFRPPPVEKLRAPIRPGAKQPFGTAVCANCDVRFTCNSYRQFRLQTTPGIAPDKVMQAALDEYASSTELGQWVDANMDTLGRNTLPDASDLDLGDTR
jgi:PD-(D/E)XK nuclease superfamily